MPTSTRVPCKLCGTEVLQSTYDVTGGLCGRCARGHKFCEICRKHFTCFPPASDGRFICTDCRTVLEGYPDRVRSVDFVNGIVAGFRVVTETDINHDILGNLSKTDGRWSSDPLLIPSLDCTESVSIYTDQPFPSEHQLALFSALVKAKEEFREELATRLAAYYREFSRPIYAETVGDPGYHHELTFDDLPELLHDSDVWNVLGRASRISMFRDTLSISFPTKFDEEHESSVSIRDGDWYEVRVGG